MAAAAAKVGIPRGRLVFLAVSVTFLLVASWVGLAFHIAEPVGRCLAAEGSAWDDDGCSHTMTFPSGVAVVSLLLMLALCRREAQAEAKVRKAGGESQGFAIGLESRYLRESDTLAVVAMVVIYMYSFFVMVLGLAIRYGGSRRLLEDQAGKEGHAVVESGTIITNVGCLNFWVECCCLVIPYMMLRLRRFVRANWVVALPLDAPHII
ncbi:hypothetical protein ACP70R_000868 [Stipagrostis hirtigluma subsp. patula]